VEYLVVAVLLVRPVFEISLGAVFLVPVKVPDDLALGLRWEKSGGYKRVDFVRFLPPVTRKGHLKVASLPGARFQQARPEHRRPHATLVADLIAALRSGYVSPLFLHVTSGI